MKTTNEKLADALRVYLSDLRDNGTGFPGTLRDALAEHDAQQSATPGPGTVTHNGRTFTALEIASAERGSPAWLAAVHGVSYNPWHVSQLATDTPDTPGSELPATVSDACGIVATLALRGTAESDNALAARIVACVNICEGRTTEQLHSGRFGVVQTVWGAE